ncbi:hypothetical protein CJ739_337 [Mariniflexile rhizosphaerae]|uniref:hypothetical protein n=1 Tax=unclassified Mariniflexile TaxID=2643887 RepID=UPI000CBDF44A|nr:hypothetical protein [Mariniflexile sp. TRM1-10]AXP79435.1 hypothetical protein CJ739_337 [Mariniflexile sp. TRM1-10]PLB19388.1 MAG: hypothetical protein TRG1_1686 [Flavobacteriaceae bacterium FS1-H7996/R]
MLNDRQSLILCGVMAGGIFVSGILDVLDSYLIKTLLTIIFLIILTNFFVVYSKSKKEKQNNLK